jgi:L,D-transpeptidase catalytic domain
VRRARRAGVAGVSLALSAALGAAAWPSASKPVRPLARATVALPTPPAPALKVGRPKPLRRLADVSRWAPVLTATPVRAAPRPRARIVAHLGTRTPEATANLVTVLARHTDEHGELWVRARLASLPNGLTGWVQRRALGGYTTLDTNLVIDVGRLRLKLLRDGNLVMSAPIGVGTAAAPTPRGHFYVRDKLTDYRSPAYGPLAFGTSARSATLTDWPAGGYVGIHGTNRPTLIPGRVSHGCIRLRNADLVRLARLMPVGTPLTIR